MLIDQLENELKKAEMSVEQECEYMTLLMRDQENVERGIEKGIEKGIEIGMLQERRKIIIKMIDQGFNDMQIMSICETNKEEISEYRKR